MLFIQAVFLKKELFLKSAGSPRSSELDRMSKDVPRPCETVLLAGKQPGEEHSNITATHVSNTLPVARRGREGRREEYRKTAGVRGREADRGTGREKDGEDGKKKSDGGPIQGGKTRKEI